MEDDESNISLSNRKVLGIEDSELTNDQIVGTGHIHQKKGATLNLSTIDPAKKKKKDKGDKKKKKKKKHGHNNDSDDGDSDGFVGGPPRPVRGSDRLKQKQGADGSSDMMANLHAEGDRQSNALTIN